jgi:zinc/manganese transport system permease protein
VQGLKKEFLFFLMLAITVTSSVQSAGVLVVFSLLIAPSYIGITQKRFNPFVFATSFGSLAILAALIFSYNYDLPTGYTIIFTVVSFSLTGVILQTLFSKKYNAPKNQDDYTTHCIKLD